MTEDAVELIGPCYICQRTEASDAGLCPACLTELAVITANSHLRHTVVTAMTAGLRGMDAATAIDAYLRSPGVTDSQSVATLDAMETDAERVRWIARRCGVDALRVALLMYRTESSAIRVMWNLAALG